MPSRTSSTRSRTATAWVYYHSGGWVGSVGEITGLGIPKKKRSVLLACDGLVMGCIRGFWPKTERGGPNSCAERNPVNYSGGSNVQPFLCRIGMYRLSTYTSHLRHVHKYIYPLVDSIRLAAFTRGATYILHRRRPDPRLSSQHRRGQRPRCRPAPPQLHLAHTDG